MHTRIRLDACALNYHRHRIGIKQSPACSCGFINESKSHYFLYCPNYAAQRQTLLTSAACIASNLWSRFSDRQKNRAFYIWFIFTKRRTKLPYFLSSSVFYKKFKSFCQLIASATLYFVYIQRTSEPMHCTCTTFVDLDKYKCCDSVSSLDEHFCS